MRSVTFILLGHNMQIRNVRGFIISGAEKANIVHMIQNNLSDFVRKGRKYVLEQKQEPDKYLVKIYMSDRKGFRWATFTVRQYKE